MNQKELALLCGCTQATVSKALRGASGISPDMREKILITAQKYGISQKYDSTAMGNMVLVITPEYRSEYYANILSCLSGTLRKHDFDIISTTYEFDNHNLVHLLRLVRSIRRLSGIISLFSIPENILAKLTKTGVPIIEYGNKCVFPLDRVVPSIYDGIQDALVHLRDTGRRNIAFVGEKNTAGKELCFRQGMKELGLPVDEQFIYCSDLRFSQAGTYGFKALYSLDKTPDAIICAYDYIAFGVLNAAFAANIRVPQQLAVIGMDNISATATYQVGLTTIGIDYWQLSAILVNLLIQRISEPDAPVQQITLKHSLIVRETG